MAYENCSVITGNADAVEKCEDLVGSGIGTKSVVGGLFESLADNAIGLAFLGIIATIVVSVLVWGFSFMRSRTSYRS